MDTAASTTYSGSVYTINHSNSVTAGTVGDQSAKTLTWSDTFKVPKVVYDAQGHIKTGTTDITLTMPANPNTDEKVKQSTSGTTDFRPIVLGYTNSSTVSNLDATITNQVYVTTKLYTQPSTGKLFIGYSTQSSYPTGGIHVHDVRSVDVTPDVAAEKSANFYFHQYTLDGTNNYFWGILNVRGWTGAYSSWEIAGPAHNVDQRTTPLYVRTSNKNTAWGNWRKIYDTANKPTAADVGAVPNTKAGMNAAIDLLDTGLDSVEMTDSMTFISHDTNASTVAYLKRSNLVMYNYIYKKLQHNNAMDVSHTFGAWNTVGWHRCFSMPCSATASGRIIRTLEITVYRNYNNGQPEYFKVRLAGLYNATESFDVLYQKSNTAATQYITKIRMVKSADSKTLYIDLYYNSTNSNANTMYVKWYDPDNSLTGSEKITWSSDADAQAVQDDSLTVVATLDIPWVAGDGYYKGSTGHWGVMFPGGSTAGWLRTSASGLLPNTTAGLTRTTGSSLGTSSWAFLNGYIKNIYGVSLNVYNSAATYKHTITSIASADRTITIPNYSGTVMVTGIGDALTSSNDLDTDTKDITKHWYSTAASVSATITNSPVIGYGFHVFNIPTSAENNKYQKQLLFGNTSVIPYMYRYLSNGTWSGGWRSPGTGFFYVLGTQNAKTKMWTGVLPIPQLHDGLTIAFYLPYDVAASQNSTVWDASSNSNVWLQLTLSNGQTTDWVPVYWNNQSRMTTHFSAGATILLTYWSTPKINGSNAAAPVSKEEGGQTVYWPSIARWTRADYNSNTNTLVTQNVSTANKNYPLLLSYYETSSSTTTAQTANRATAIYANPSTGTITATTFNGAATKLSTDAGSEIRPVYFTNGVPTRCAATYGSLTGSGYNSSKPYYKIAETIDIETANTQYRICFLVSRRKTGDSTMDASYGILCVHFESGSSNGSFGRGSAKWLAVENDFDISNVNLRRTTGTNKFKIALWFKLSNANDVVIVQSFDVLGFSYASNSKVWSFISNPTAATYYDGTEIAATIPTLQNYAGGGQKLLYNGSITISAVGNQLAIANLDHYQTLLVEVWHGTAGKSFRFICPVQYVLAQTDPLVAFQTSDQLTSSDLSSGSVNVGITTTSITLLILISGYSGTTATVRIYSI